MADVQIKIVRATIVKGEFADVGAEVSVDAQEATLLIRLGKAMLVSAEPETASAEPSGETAAMAKPRKRQS